MRKVIVLCAVAAMSIRQASADDMSYTYLQVDLQGAELYGGYGILSGAGHAVRGSLELGKYLYAFGDYGNTKYAGNGLQARLLPRSAGLGVRVAFSSAIDIYGGVSAEWLTIRTAELGFTDDLLFEQSFQGWGAVLGGRGWLGESFQWTFDVEHRELRNLADINSVSLGGRYYFRRAWAVGMDFTYQKYDNHLLFGRDSLGSLNVRYTFGGY